MKEFTFNCPACNQSIKSSASQSGKTIECPTCFQRIVIPQAPESENPKYITTAVRATEKKKPADNAYERAGSTKTSLPKGESARGKFPVIAGIIGVAVVLLGAGAFFLHGTFSKSGGSGTTSVGASAAADSQASAAQPASEASPNSISQSAATNGTATLPVELSSGRIGFRTWDTQVAISNVVVTSEGQILYISDFSSSKPKNWTFGNGRWVGVNGVLEQLGPGLDPTAVTGDGSWSNYVFKAEVCKIGGNQGFMLLFNFKDVNNFAMVQIGGFDQGLAAFHSVVNGNEVVGPKVHYAVTMHRWYNVELDVNNNNARCYVDGKLILAVGSF
jgi:hypothetical protein